MTYRPYSTVRNAQNAPVGESLPVLTLGYLRDATCPDVNCHAKLHRGRWQSLIYQPLIWATSTFTPKELSGRCAPSKPWCQSPGQGDRVFPGPKGVNLKLFILKITSEKGVANGNQESCDVLR